MNISIQINDIPDQFKDILSQLINEFSNFGNAASNMVDGEPVIIDFTKLPHTPEVSDYMAQIVSSSMALHSMSKI